MNSSGDAAEQIVRLSLEGVEVATKITGTGAKELAIILYTILKNKDKNKVSGRAKLTSMLKSGKELKVFTVSDENLKTFSQEAKRYGILYCALRDKRLSNDGMVDIIVRAEDAVRINRIVERFKLSTVDTATIKSEIERTKNDKYVSEDKLIEDKKVKEPELEKKISPKTDDNKLLNDLMAKPQKKEVHENQNPQLAKVEKSPPSEPILEKQNGSEKGTTKITKPSVREDLKEIKMDRERKLNKENKEIKLDKPILKNNVPQKEVKSNKSKVR